MSKVTKAHVDARLASIRQAAMTMFVRKGVDAATMQEIASAAGLSAGAIYRYYPSKEALLRTVCAYCVEESRDLFQQASVASATPWQGLIALGRTVWERMKGEDAAASTILDLEGTLASARDPHGLGPARREMRHALIDMMEAMVRKAQTAGEIDPSLDARSVAVMLLSCTAGLGIYALEAGDRIDLDGVLTVLIELLRGYAPKEV